MCRRHRTKGLRTILLKLGIVERLCYRPTKLSLGFLNWLPICFSLIKKVILIRLMLWGLLMMLLILFERFLFALSFGLIFLCLYNIKVDAGQWQWRWQSEVKAWREKRVKRSKYGKKSVAWMRGPISKLDNYVTIDGVIMKTRYKSGLLTDPVQVNVKGARMKIKRRARTEHDYEISFRTMYCYYVKRRMYT
ncbi:hypothetical protein HanIR_Chr07g0331941 [Helianthus annuus]|nr:hypothetical protein HanIR_Chr07g0331941 [Helianthus annuus]